MELENSGFASKVADELRDLYANLLEDLASLRRKWRFYQELFGSQEIAALLSEVAPAFFQTIEESDRNDIILAICRLSDPSRTLGGDALSLASLVARCEQVPKLEHLLTALQSACGSVRRYRNRRLAHNDPSAILKPREELLPGVARTQIDEILELAGQILSVVAERVGCAAPQLEPPHEGGVSALVESLRIARDRRADRSSGHPTATRV